MLGRSNAEETITLKDVPAEAFIKAYAAHLKKTQKVTPLDGHEHLKTACYKDMQPQCSDWYYTRAAAIARKVFLRPDIGVGRLKHLFGSVRRNGHCSNSHGRASGKIIRHAMIQLEKAGVITRVPSVDSEIVKRRISKEGQKEINEVAKNVFSARLGVTTEE